MKKQLILLYFILSACGLILLSGHVSAAFNPNRIIDDAIFDNSSTMTATQIDVFLNQFPNSCISPNKGFLAVDPTGYSPSTGYTYGGNVTAGAVISHAAQAYDLNPQVLISTLQKEEGLVRGDGTYGCSTLAISAAVGYGCPDNLTLHDYNGVNLYTRNGVTVTSVSQTCVNSASKVGFSQQVIHAAWLFKFAEQRSKGNVNWAIVRGNWNNSDDPQSCYSGPMTQGNFQVCPSGTTTYYDGYRTIDGTAVHMDTGGTAALYWYTPHFGGNQNFVNIFTGWFGNPVGAGYQFISATNPPDQILPNDVVSVQIQVINRSGTTWYSDGNVPAGGHPTRLSTITYQNTPFANPSDPAWLGSSNQVKMKEASVADGGTATFQFTFRGPMQSTGIYQTRWTLVLDGAYFMPYIGMAWNNSTPAPSYGYQVTGSSGITSNMPTNYTNPVSYSIKNTGNIVWFSDDLKPAGAAPIRITTTLPFYHNSPFYDSSSWLTTSQIKYTGTKVVPGGTASFSFNLKTPSTSNLYTETFGLSLDGLALYPDNGQMHFSVNVNDYNYSLVSTDLPNTLIQGQKYNCKVVIKNTGVATWYADGSTPPNTHPVRLMMAGYRSNVLADQSDPAWLGTTSQIKMTTTAVAPNSNGEFDFSFVAPYSSNGAFSDFRVVVDGVSILPGTIQRNTAIPLRQLAYFPVPGTINPPSVMSKGQIANVKLFIKNNTNFVWYNDSTKPSFFRGGSVRVLMINPYYRNSAFGNPSDSAWLGTSSQVKMLSTIVNPGDTAEFDFTWKAPNNTGQYHDKFSLVLDGYDLFPNIGMEFNTTVQ